MSDSYLLLSRFQPAATLANPFHSLIDFKGQCGFLRAWQKLSIFYHFKLSDMSAPTFYVLISGFIGFRQLISESCFLNATLPIAACPFLLVVRSSIAQSDCSHRRLADMHFCIASSLGQPFLKRGGRKREASFLFKRHGDARLGYKRINSLISPFLCDCVRELCRSRCLQCVFLQCCGDH